MLLPLLYWCVALSLLSAAEGQRRPASPPRAPRPPPESAPGASDILEQIGDISPDGSFHTKWVSANGISFEESGQPKSLPGGEVAQEVQGAASWTSSDGEPVSLSWRADENGAVFQGDHLPTAPPLPPLIQRALDFIAANPPRGAQEGAYEEEPAPRAQQQQQQQQQQRPAGVTRRPGFPRAF